MNIYRYIIYSLILVLCGGACSDDDKEPLTANLKADKTEIVAGEEITFTDQSSGTPTKWNWTFEGGEPAESILFSPAVVYNTPGKYFVQLVVGRDDSDSDVIKKELFVTVNYPGTINADFTVDKTSVLSGEVIKFTDTSVGYPTEWKWEFTTEDETNLTSNEQHPEMTLPPGVYTVKLTVSNPETSAEISKENLVTVIDPFLVSAEFGTKFHITYGGGAIQFEDQSIGTVESWEWSFEGGIPATSSEQHPKVKYDSPGKYKVKLVASNANYSSTKEIDGFVSVIPGNGLVAFYPFEDDASDIGPNNTDIHVKSVTGAGAVLFDKESQKQGYYSAKFNNLDSKNYGILEVAEHIGFNFAKNDFTISFWMKTSEDRQMALWMEGGGKVTPKKQSWFRVDKVSAAQFSSFVTEDNSGGVWCNYKEKRLTDNKWHHIICMRSGSELRTYVDGVLAVKNTGVLRDASDDTPFLIGCMSTPEGGYKAYYTGLVDDFIVYNRAISDTEVDVLYNY